MEAKKAFRKLVSVVGPILVAQFSTVGMNFVDTTMAGHAGATDLAGVSVGAGLFLPILISTIGVMSAATPMAAQLLGKKRPEDIPEVIRTGMFLGVLIFIFFILLFFGCMDSVMESMQPAPEVAHVAYYYMLCMVVCAFFEAQVMVLRSLTDTVGGTKISMRLFLLALPIDAILNYIFIFGNCGAPRLGGIGAGIATVMTYASLYVMFLWIVRKEPMFRGKEIFSTWRTRGAVWKEYLRIGIPNAAAMFMESSLFGFIVIFIAPFGTTMLAAHQAAMNFSGATYTLPLSFSMALTIVIGVEVGAGRFENAKVFRRVGIASALVLAALSSLATILLRTYIAGLYTTDGDVADAVCVFLMFAAAWQCFDAIGAPIQGILRGYKDAKVPSVLMMIAYWCVCFPVGLAADRLFGFGAASYWLGLDVGVSAAALLLCARLWQIEKKYVKGTL